MRNRSEKAVYWGAFILDWFKYLQDNELTSSDFKVLFFLCRKMQFNDNTIYIRQKKITEELNMDKGNVSKCIKKLCKKQFIVKTENGFMINPHLFYIGKRYYPDREELRRKFDKTLEDNKIKPRFLMNEDEYELIDLENPKDDFLNLLF